MSDLNIRFSNCFDFINNTKQYLEANPTDWRNIYTEEELIRAECDLMEMELEALYDTKEYDALLNGNVFRSSKRAQRRKANIRHHKTDRYHGKCFEGRENGKRIYKDRYCRFPISDRVHNHSALKAEAREQEFFSHADIDLEESSTTDTEIIEPDEEENRGLEDFLWYLIDELPEQKYIMIYDYDNGGEWEDHEYCTNKFLGVMTKDEVIHKITENFLRNDCGVDVNETEIRGLKGASFHWDFECDRWGWNGYEDFTIIPVSRLI